MPHSKCDTSLPVNVTLNVTLGRISTGRAVDGLVHRNPHFVDIVVKRRLIPVSYRGLFHGGEKREKQTERKHKFFALTPLRVYPGTPIFGSVTLKLSKRVGYRELERGHMPCLSCLKETTQSRNG